MLNKEWKWHYFMLHGMEYLVLGYNAQRHNVLCVSLQHLHEKDKEDLMWIVDSDEAQKEAYLVAILARHPYAGGGSWWERLQPHIFFAEESQVFKRIPTTQTEVFWEAYRTHNNTTGLGRPATAIEPIRQKALEAADAAGMEAISPGASVGLPITGTLWKETSTPEPEKTENIDDILFGVVLTEEDRQELAQLKRLAGIL